MAGKKPVTQESGMKGKMKGGPEGANAGGASRGAARMEPSHVNEAAKADKGAKGIGKKDGGKGKK